MGQYDDIVASYVEKQAKLRAQLKMLNAGDSQSATLPVRLAIQRIEREIRDLDGAIYRCCTKSRTEMPSAALPQGRDEPDLNGSCGTAPGSGRRLTQIVFRCAQAGRVVTTGIEIDAALFQNLRTARVMRCQFCGEDHPWDVAKRAPATAALMSAKAEDYLGRSVQSEAHAAQATDPGVRELYERMADQWYRLAIEHEAKAAALS